MIKTYSEEGILYEVEVKGTKLEFPLDTDLRSYKKYYKSSEWEKISILEQLWVDGQISRVKGNVYLLPNENLFDLEELYNILDIPRNKVDVEVYETSTIVGRDYKICWKAVRNGIELGGVARTGCILRHFSDEFILTKEQYTLLSTIDGLEPKIEFAERAKDIAYVKKLVEEMGAKMDTFSNSRDFLYTDTVDINLVLNDPQSISFCPEVEHLSTEEIDNLSLGKTHAGTVVNKGKTKHVFFSPAAQDTFENIKNMPMLQGSNVPRFIDNPLSFIGDEIEFDQNKFAERVKGLKIHKSSAQPFVAITRDENAPGWFSYTTGIELVSDNDELTEFNNEVKARSEVLKEKIHEAYNNGEDYIFFDDQWIKVDSKLFEKFDAEVETIRQLSDSGRLDTKAVHQILDIYDNVEGFDYSETKEDEVQEKRTKIYSVPESFRGTLKDYQVEGYSFLCSQFQNKLGSLLADDMGLGKTAQVIAFMLYLREQKALKPSLIVVPSVLIQNWEEEIGKFGPGDIFPYVYQGSHRYKDSEFIADHEIVITTYETLARDQIVLGMVPWKLMVCDETQKIKNYKTLIASAVKGMNSECRIAMTGTPVENRLGELWSIVDFVQPGLLKDYRWFKKKYEEPIQGSYENSKETIQNLIETIKPILLRRLKTDVLSGLPQKNELKYDVELSRLQSQMYKEVLDNMRSDTSAGNMAVLQAIQSLIMVCSHPRLAQGDINVDASKLIKESAKLADTVSVLKSLRKKNEKVLIFTKYRKMQSILKRVIFDEFGIDAKIINGEDNSNRQECVAKFNKSAGFNVLILSPKAAGVGLNITSANNVIHFTREWNPAIENQATDRVYRIGQERDVTVYYPISTYPQLFTVEEKLNDLLESKRTLMKNVVVPVELQINAMDFSECLR